MKNLAAAVAFSAALASGAALADTMENAYGNTIIVTYANGAAARYHFNADGSFSAAMPDGSTLTGIWNVAEGEICFLPSEGGARTCSPYAGDKSVGDSWTQVGSDGSNITVTIEPGR